MNTRNHEEYLNVKKHLAMLGLRVRDKVTGLKGVATSVCFDLYGCIQVAINPGTDKNGKTQDSHWIDVSRIEVLSPKPVMERPNFEYGPVAEGRQGSAEKPKSMPV